MVCEHKHVIVRAELNWFYNGTQEIHLHEFMTGIIRDLKMNLMKGPMSCYLDRPGLKGWSSVVLIETSHIVLHSWDEDSPVLLQLDVYTCGEMNLEVVQRALAPYGIRKFDYYLIDRATEIKLIVATKSVTIWDKIKDYIKKWTGS